jgi:hypothetical protein
MSRIQIIARDASKQTKALTAEGNMSIDIQSPSIIQIQQPIKSVSHYIRQGDDLLIYMKDGSIIRCDHFFLEDDDNNHSELVFHDDATQTITHVEFAELAASSDLDMVVLDYSETVLANIEPLMLTGSESDLATWGIIGAGILGAGGIAAIVANNHHSKTTEHNVVEVPKETEALGYNAVDDKGSKVGLLKNNDITDDNRPTFSGTGKAGSTIQIKNESGETIASGQVAANGTWEIELGKDLTLGKHTFSVVQIDGANAPVQIGDKITLTVVNAGTLTINNTGDNVLNAAEKNAESGVTLTGKSTELPAGSQITVELNGKSYEATIAQNGSWSVIIPKADAAVLTDGHHIITVTGKDSAGNPLTAASTLTVDSQVSININPVSSDDLLGNAELHQPLMVSGHVSGVEAGRTVTIALNGKNYTTQVNADGSWSKTIPASDVAGLTNGVAISATVADKAGNIATANKTIQVDTTDPTISFNTIANDNVINSIEHGQAQTISGTSTGAAGGKLILHIAGEVYEVPVSANGNWSVTVPASVISALADGALNITASLTDSAGNTGYGSQSVQVDTTPPALTINAIGDDGILNAAETATNLVISGTTTAEAGQIVEITLNNVTYTAIVQADGTWSTNVPAADLAALNDGDIHSVTATVRDSAGNDTTVAEVVEINISAPTVYIHDITGDNVLNASEVNQAQVITGHSPDAAAGDLITLTIGGQTYTTSIQADGTWSVGVPASVIASLVPPQVNVGVTLTDSAGNFSSVQKVVTINTNVSTIGVDQPAGDGILNAIEHGAALTITGTSDLAGATPVTVNLNGQNYAATTAADGSWSVTIPAADVAQLGQANYIITASATDGIGNLINDSAHLQVDTSLPNVFINSVTSDDVLNLAEVSVQQILSGRVTNAEAGDTVTIILNGVTYTAAVQSDLTWSVPVSATDLTALGDGALTIVASVTNSHGNTGSGSRDISVDANLPGLRINTVAGDDIINAIEHSQNLIVSGTSTGIAAGGTVVVTINGNTYNASVNADGTWSASVLASDVSAWTAGNLIIAASATDAANNPVSIQHQVIVDLAPVAISIDPVTGDNILNASEKGAGITLSGTVDNVEAGQTVNIVFAGHSYTATVQTDGTWSVNVPPADISSLTDSDVQVQVSVTNTAGNSASAAQGVHVDISAPALTINSITADDVLNAAETGAALIISGTSSAETGQTVNITFNGGSYSATVQADGTWNVLIPAADLTGLTDGSIYNVNAAVSDNAGNISSADRAVLIDSAPVTVTINTVAGDNIINSSEHQQAQIISGSSNGAAAGDVLTLTIAGNTYTTTVDASGHWSIGVPAGVISAIADGNVTITASLTDAAGNSGSISNVVVVDTTAPTLNIGAIDVDNILNAAEKGEDLTISGSSNLPANTNVTVTLNGLDYPAITLADGSWTLNIPAADLAALGEAHYTVIASATNSSGNSVSDSAHLQVDTSLPNVFINSVTPDDVLNLAEVSVQQILSGRVTNAEAGSTVTIILNGVTYTAAVQSDLTWSVPVSAADLTALGDGALTIVASVTNSHGNTGSGSRDISVDASLPGLRINTVAGDDIINAIEHNQNLIVSGTSTGIAAGGTVVVTINGNTYNASVNADGTWSASVPVSDVSAWTAGNLTITASAADAANNPVSIQHQVIVDLAPVAISIDPVTGDNILNASEKGAGITLSGTVDNVEAGQTVNIVFAGHSYTATVQTGGTWSVNVPPADISSLTDGDVQVQVSVTNTAGNSASAAQGVHVDISAPALTINSITADDVLNAAETGAALIISGTSSAETGQTVNITFNGESYSATVQADGTWSTAVPDSDLIGITDGAYNVHASVSDNAGNQTTADRNVLVDTTALVITVNTIAGDNIINNSEHQQAQIISGSVTGVETGDVLTLIIDGNTYTTTIDAVGNWSIGLPASVVSGLSDGAYPIVVSITDKAGNSATDNSHSVTVNTALPVLTIDNITGDNLLNAAEKTQPLTITGTADASLNDGTDVTVTLNGIAYHGTVTSGVWSVTVPNSDVVNLGEALYSVTVTATDSVGNQGSTVQQLQVDSVNPGITIDPIASDDIINAAETAIDQAISGSVVGAAAGDTVTITLGGNQYTATVQGDLTWNINVPSTDLIALGDGVLTVNASVTANGNGNSGSAQREIEIDANLPGLRIDIVAGDDIINAIEHGQNLIISGTSDDIAAGSTITVNANGVNYYASVNADGTWRVAVPQADVTAWAVGNVMITASGADTSANPVTIQRPVTVDLGADVYISIDTVAADNVLNAAEKGADLTLSGSTTAEAGNTVNIVFAGHSYTATVQTGGTWSVIVPAANMSNLNDGDTSVQVSVSNNANNSASAAQHISVDTSAPMLSINSITADDVLNAAEAGTALILSGTSNAEAGNTVNITFNGGSYTATVQANGTWSTTVPDTDLSAITDGSYNVNATVSDNAGNVTSADRSVLVDTTAPTITINTVAGDDIINSSEHALAQIISGISSGAAAGDIVTVTIGSNHYTATVDAAGSWHVGVPASVG